MFADLNSAFMTSYDPRPNGGRRLHLVPRGGKHGVGSECQELCLQVPGADRRMAPTVQSSKPLLWICKSCTTAHPHIRTPAHPHTRRSETFLSSLFLRNPLTPPPSPPNPCLPPNNILIMCGICNDCMVTNIGPVVHVVCYPCRFACPDAGGANDSSSNAKRWVGYKR